MNKHTNMYITFKYGRKDRDSGNLGCTVSGENEYMKNGTGLNVC